MSGPSPRFGLLWEAAPSPPSGPGPNAVKQFILVPTLPRGNVSCDAPRRSGKSAEAPPATQSVVERCSHARAWEQKARSRVQTPPLLWGRVEWGLLWAPPSILISTNAII